MKSWKTVVFSLIPAVVVFLLVEGVAQIYWSYRERQALNAVAANGERMLRNDAINFLKQPDSILGYRLRPNLRVGSAITNSRGFAQLEEVDESRIPGSLRIMSIGESTTHGSASTVNYPFQLKKVLQECARGYSVTPEVINAGVSGWISDQWTIYSETELHRYRPDLVILYAGWNDFQAYDPFQPPPTISFFDQHYGGRFPLSGTLKSVVLARAILERYMPSVFVMEETKSASPYAVAHWQADGGASVQPSANGTTQIALRDSGTASIVIDATYFKHEARQTDSVRLLVKGEGVGQLRMSGRSKSSQPSYGSLQFHATREWTEVRCSFAKPVDGQDLQISLVPESGKSLIIDVKEVEVTRTETDGSSAVIATSGAIARRDIGNGTYRMLFRNLLRTVNAFRTSNPNVKIVLSSLVCRWPMDTDDQFDQSTGHVWWMGTHQVDRIRAKRLVDNLNRQLQHFSAENGLIFVDIAHAFSTLDRQRLMWDWAHMIEDGYRIMAHTFYRELRRRGIIAGVQNPGLDSLLSRYAVATSDNPATNR